MALLLSTGCSMGPETEFEADVLDVVAADTLVLDVDGERRTVRLGGIVVPNNDECLAQDALDATEGRVGGGQGLTFTVLGRDASGLNVVAVDWFYENDLATDLVAEGLAIPDARESGTPLSMRAARDEAMERGEGFFKEYEDCTFAAMYATAMAELTDATDHGEPTTSDGAEYLLTALIAAVATAEATEQFAQQAHQDLRLLAYSSQSLSTMMTDVVAKKKVATTQARQMRSLKRTLLRQERAERIWQREETARFWREYDSSHSGSSSSSDGSRDSGGSSSGYTGPRCYAPGGKVWHPC